MTCCVGLVADDGAVYLGADSASIEGTDLVIRKDSKIFRNGEFLFATCGSWRSRDLLHYRFSPPPHHHGYTTDAYMRVCFAEAVRDLYTKAGFATTDEGRENGSLFLVGYRGRLFQLGTDYHVGEPAARYHAIGCGDNQALGALHALDGRTAYGHPIRPYLRVLAALEASEAYSAGVRRPFTIDHLDPPKEEPCST